MLSAASTGGPVFTAAPVGGRGGIGTDTQIKSLFEEYGTRSDFQLLRYKHTLADLVHDFGKPFLDTIGTRNIIDRITGGVPGASAGTVINSVGISILESFFEKCTTDASAKKSFYEVLEKFFFENNIPDFNSFKQVEQDTENLQSMLTEIYNKIQGESLYWYLDSQSGNIIKNYETYRTTKDGVLQSRNNFCEDAATKADPASGINPSKVGLAVYNGPRNISFPANISGLGKELQLQIAGSGVNASWAGSSPILIQGKTSSIENVCKTIRKLGDSQMKLDHLLLKTSGDRAQAYACNETYTDITPLFKTLDILASIDAMFYRKCPILVSGPNNIKLYSFGGTTIPDITGDEAKILEGLTNENINSLFDTSMGIIERYFQDLITTLGSDKILNAKFDDEKRTPTPGVAISGLIFTLIDTLEKVYYYQMANDKYKRSDDYTTVTLQEDKLTYLIKYKPLLSQNNMNEYFRTDMFNSKSYVMYTKITSIFDTIESESMRPTLTFMMIKDLCFKEIQNCLSSYVTKGNCPINLISLLLTTLMLQITLPPEPGVGSTTTRSGQQGFLVNAREHRIRWIHETLNQPKTKKFASILFGELLIIDAASGSIGFVNDIRDKKMSVYIPFLQRVMALSFDILPPYLRVELGDIREEDISEFRVADMEEGLGERTLLEHKVAKLIPEKFLSIEEQLTRDLQGVARIPGNYVRNNPIIQDLLTRYIDMGMTKRLWTTIFNKNKPVQGGGALYNDDDPNLSYLTADLPYTSDPTYPEDSDYENVSPSYGTILFLLKNIQRHILTEFKTLAYPLEVAQLIIDSILTGTILYNSQNPGDNIYVVSAVAEFMTNVLKTPDAFQNHVYNVLEDRFVSTIPLEYFYGLQPILDKFLPYVAAQIFDIAVNTSAGAMVNNSGFESNVSSDKFSVFSYTGSTIHSSGHGTITPPKNPMKSIPIITPQSGSKKRVLSQTTPSTVGKYLKLVSEEENEGVTRAESTGADKKGETNSSGRDGILSQDMTNHTWNTTSGTLPSEGGRRSRRRQRKRSTYKKKRASQKRRTYRRHH